MADLILILHFLWVAFVVLSVPLIALGGRLGWGWVRHRWYRRVHIIMMGIVTAEALLGVVCPLTLWENRFRRDGGYEQGFVAHYVSRLLYYDFDPAVFTVAYVAFLGLILALYRWVPPR